jgi:hypothetical protein
MRAVLRRPSSLVRRRKLTATVSRAGRRAVANGDVLAALAAAPGAAALAEEGLRRTLLAALARSLGYEVTVADVEGAREAWRRALALTPAAFGRFLVESGLDGADSARLCEDLALERRLLTVAASVVPDGPSQDEGLALGARLVGTWAAESRRIARGRRRLP